MKHFLLYIISIVLCSSHMCNAMAQKTTTGAFHLKPEARFCMSIPKEYTYSHKPLLLMRGEDDDKYVMVYDENIDLVEKITMDKHQAFNYTLSYNTETRDVKSVDKTETSKRDIYSAFEDWKQRQLDFDPNLSSSDFIISKQENGDSIISVALHDDYYIRQMYFGYDYFGTKYQRRYWLCSNGKMYQCDATYNVSYTEWKSAGITQTEYSKDVDKIFLKNMNLDNGSGEEGTFFDVSQTLFNQDEAFEYLVPKYALSANSTGGNNDVVIGGNNPYDDNIVLSRSTIASEKSNVVMVGFQVVSSNGNVVKDLDFDGGFETNLEYDNPVGALITIGGNVYIAFNGYANGEECSVFYKVDRTSTNIQKVKSAPASMRIFPSVTNKNTAITVDLNDDNVGGSELIVYSSTGIAVNKISVPANQKSTTFSVNASTGVYNVVRIHKNQAKEVKKIIIR